MSQKVVVCVGTAVVGTLLLCLALGLGLTLPGDRFPGTATGGNVLNGICALAEFGTSTRLVTCMGQDANASLLLALCDRLGVDVSFVKKAGTTPFSYIIVDAQSHTRTIIHTPGMELRGEDVTRAMMHDAALLYLDTRHPDAAVQAIEWAREAQVPIVLDIEHERGKAGQEQVMLTSATVIISSGTYVLAHTRETDLLTAMTSLLNKGVAQYVVTTWGEHGCILLRRSASSTHPLVASVDELKFRRSERPALSAEAWLSRDNALRRFSFELKPKVALHGGDAAQRFEVIHCVAYPLQASQFVDGTAAGDVFIGTMCYATLHVNKFPDVGDALRLASYCAALKCTKAGGASKGMPALSSIPKELLPSK